MIIEKIFLLNFLKYQQIFIKKNHCMHFFNTHESIRLFFNPAAVFRKKPHFPSKKMLIRKDLGSPEEKIV